MDDLSIAQALGPVTLDSIREGVYAIRMMRAVNYGAITVMLWDMLLNFDREVELMWKSRWNFVKVFFFFNRIALAVLAVDVWFLGDSEWELSVPVCRKWYTAAYMVQILSSALISLLVACRLWAWYELSTRMLYLLFSVWFSGFVASTALMLNGLWGRDNGLVHLSALNVCLTIKKNIWAQWVPGALAHSSYFVFLFISALNAPRSSRHTALAILYRDGLYFYLVTSVTMLLALFTWSFAPRLYMGVIIYIPWIVMQIHISRLLLHVRTSHIFYDRPIRRRRSSTAAAAISQLPADFRTLNGYPLQSLQSTLPRGDVCAPPTSPATEKGDGHSHLSTLASPDARTKNQSQHSRSRRSVSVEAPGPTRGTIHQPSLDPDTPDGGERGEGGVKTDLEDGSDRSEVVFVTQSIWLPEWLRTHPVMRRLWWLAPRRASSSSDGSKTNSHDVYVYVEDCVEESGGGLRESRLGRYDHWL